MEGSTVAMVFGGSIPAYIAIILFFATTIINMEGCLLVLVSSFIGKENRWVESLKWARMRECFEQGINDQSEWRGHIQATTLFSLWAQVQQKLHK